MLIASTAVSCGLPATASAPGETISVVDTHPVDGGTYEAGHTIDLCFDRLLDPRTVDPADFVIASGPIVVDADVFVQLRPWYGPGGQPAAEAPWCDGSVVSVRPRAGLRGGVRYRLRMRPDPVGWNGETIDVSGPGFLPTEDGDDPVFTLEFETPPSDADALAPWSPPTPAPSLGDLFAPGRPFAPGGLCGCHDRGDARADPTAVARLDLSDPSVAFDDLLTPPGALSESFPMVAPGDPSGSFLLHKILRTEGGLALRGVRGIPMPPDGPLPHPAFVDVARWIEGGAMP